MLLVTNCTRRHTLKATKLIKITNSPCILTKQLQSQLPADVTLHHLGMRFPSPLFLLQSVPLTPQTPLTPDSMGQISPHPGMPSFTYPSAASNYDGIPSTPTAVSPIVSYPHNSAWTSPTATSIPHFDPTVDYSSPIVSVSSTCLYDLRPSVARPPVIGD
jgi:hypothetical protein